MPAAYAPLTGLGALQGLGTPQAPRKQSSLDGLTAHGDGDDVSPSAGPEEFKGSAQAHGLGRWLA